MPEDAAEPSFAVMLQELSRRLRGPRKTLNLFDYYQLLEHATGYTIVAPGSVFERSVPAITVDSVNYVVFFLANEAAEAFARKQQAQMIVLPVRKILQCVPDGYGIDIDWSQDNELRIAPDEVTDLNERLRIWPVRQEATHDWLSRVNEQLALKGVAASDRHAVAASEWQRLNGFRVLKRSTRDLRIRHFFEAEIFVNRAERRVACERLWRNDYNQDPYLHHLSLEDLLDRLSSIRINLLYTNRTALPQEFGELEWSERFHHVRLECERRSSSFVKAIQSRNILDAWPRLNAATAAYESYEGQSGQLFRFSKEKWLRPLLERGDLTIFPAARYDDPSLLTSQQDDERTRTTILDSKKMRIERVDATGIRHPMNILGSVKMRTRPKGNYYVWFTTTCFDPRLFDDFDADACLIIHDGRTFSERLYAAVEKVLPGWLGAERLIRYFDPVKAAGEALARFEKDFRFAYQREYRFVWEAPAPHFPEQLDSISVNLGDLRDVANLITI